MSDSAMDKELEAIKTIANALKPLDPEVRRRVLQYAIQHLGIAEVPSGAIPAAAPTPRASANDTQPRQPGPDTTQRIVDIRTFKHEKDPKSDVQMAALVAYYLAKLAPADLRKESIMSADITTYFDQAAYPLPNEARMTLVNAKNAGYLDSAGRGQYKLNPVGHNLVAHNLPKSGGGDAPQRRRRKKVSKKPGKKKGKSGRSKKGG